MTIDSDGVIIVFNIFKYKTVSMIVVFDIEPVEPFSFHQGMEGFDTGNVIRITEIA